MLLIKAFSLRPFSSLGSHGQFIGHRTQEMFVFADLLLAREKRIKNEIRND
jgi:hypothetical protein